jgi:hypothetical protein
VYFRVEPHECPVDQPVEVRLTATIDDPLEKGDRIAFAPPEAWSSQPYCITFTKEPQLADPERPDYVSVSAEGACLVTAIEHIKLAAGTDKGHVRKIVATVQDGRVPAGGQVVLWLHNYTSTWLAETGLFRIWLGDREITEDPPTIQTTPAPAVRVRVIVPSCAKPGEPFRVQIVSYDRFWNRSSSTFRYGILRVQGGEVLEEGIGFTGSYTTQAVLSEPGVYRLRYQDLVSNPIRITANPQGPYWGDLHAHDKFHNCGAGEAPFAYGREVSCLDFVGVAPDFRGLGPEVWAEHVRRTDAANEPGRFTTILSYEAGFRQGHHNVYLRHGEGQIFDVTDETLRTLECLLPTLDPEEAIVVPHHLGIHWCSQARYFPERDPWIPLLEIYSQHGLSEAFWPEHALSYEFNRTRGLEEKHATSLDKSVYARDAWAQGRRYGVIASSDDHMGQPGKPIKGLAAVLSPSNTREEIWQALKGRRTYGTTGERILLDFRINGHEMGQEVFVAGDEPLTVEVEVHGTDEIGFVEVARLRFDQGTWESAFVTRTMVRDLFAEQGAADPLDFEASFQEPFVSDAVYYLRVGQKKQLDNFPVFAWSSPIWVTKGLRP